MRFIVITFCFATAAAIPSVLQRAKTNVSGVPSGPEPMKTSISCQHAFQQDEEAVASDPALLEKIRAQIRRCVKTCDNTYLRAAKVAFRAKETCILSQRRLSGGGYPAGCIVKYERAIADAEREQVGCVQSQRQGKVAVINDVLTGPEPLKATLTCRHAYQQDEESVKGQPVFVTRLATRVEDCTKKCDLRYIGIAKRAFAALQKCTEDQNKEPGGGDPAKCKTEHEKAISTAEDKQAKCIQTHRHQTAIPSVIPTAKADSQSIPTGPKPLEPTLSCRHAYQQDELEVKNLPYVLRKLQKRIGDCIMKCDKVYNDAARNAFASFENCIREQNQERSGGGDPAKCKTGHDDAIAAAEGVQLRCVESGKSAKFLERNKS